MSSFSFSAEEPILRWDIGITAERGDYEIGTTDRGDFFTYGLDFKVGINLKYLYFGYGINWGQSNFGSDNAVVDRIAFALPDDMYYRHGGFVMLKFGDVHFRYANFGKAEYEYDDVLSETDSRKLKFEYKGRAQSYGIGFQLGGGITLNYDYTVGEYTKFDRELDGTDNILNQGLASPLETESHMVSLTFPLDLSTVITKGFVRSGFN